ncbi:MAG: hypothetical protein AB1744_15085, partial [Candidatus Zixiibacteriota bacterium]
NLRWNYDYNAGEVGGGNEKSKPAAYKVWVARNSLFTDIAADSGWMTDPNTDDPSENWEIPSSLADNLYYWRVGIKDDAGNIGENSENRTLRVDTLKPPTPSLFSPANGSMATSTENLKWDNLSRIDNSKPVLYRVWVARDNLFTLIEGDSGWITDNYWVISPAVVDNWYFWRVQARDNAGNLSDNSENRKFLVDNQAPGKPRLFYPVAGENENDSTPILDWEDNTEDPSQPVTYRVIVARDAAFTDIIRDNYWIENDWWEVTPALQDNVYYWKVGARDNLTPPNYGENSVVRSFRVDTLAPPRATPILPLDNSASDNFTIKFWWNSQEDNSLPIIYTIQIDNEPGFSSPLVHENTNVNDNNFTYTGEYYGYYYWRVRGRDNAGNYAEWSVTMLIVI